ncbi:hypothetical protein E6O75_ATG10815 [Venturia nashicola]|uniref:Uncharacterized protein n=1 Tax=Venturia nashicola TaxID=86259 RepID=A0A4Z1PB43_9PEZI|nr:hypothetical protein E6O75_ATG10815 [Venturia nashicola]
MERFEPFNLSDTESIGKHLHRLRKNNMRILIPLWILQKLNGIKSKPHVPNVMIRSRQEINNLIEMDMVDATGSTEERDGHGVMDAVCVQGKERIDIVRCEDVGFDGGFRQFSRVLSAFVWGGNPHSYELEGWVFDKMSQGNAANFTRCPLDHAVGFWTRHVGGKDGEAEARR